MMKVNDEEWYDVHDGVPQAATFNVLSTEDGQWLVEWEAVNPGGAYTHIRFALRVPGELRDTDVMRKMGLRQALEHLKAALALC